MTTYRLLAEYRGRRIYTRGRKRALVRFVLDLMERGDEVRVLALAPVSDTMPERAGV